MAQGGPHGAPWAPPWGPRGPKGPLGRPSGGFSYCPFVGMSIALCESQKSDFWGGFPRRERRMTRNRAWKSQKSNFWRGFPRRERRMTRNRAWKTTPTPPDAQPYLDYAYRGPAIPGSCPMARNRAWKSQKSDFCGGVCRRQRPMTRNRAWNRHFGPQNHHLGPQKCKKCQLL